MTSPEECNDWQVLELTTPPLADCGCLVVNNAFADGGSRAEVRILEIAKLSPPGGVAAPGSIRAAHVTGDPTSGKFHDLDRDKVTNRLSPNVLASALALAPQYLRRALLSWYLREVGRVEVAQAPGDARATYPLA